VGLDAAVGLAGVVPWFAALVWWWRSTRGHGHWQHLVDAQLLNEVSQPNASGAQMPLLILGVVLGVLITTALAGPSWRTQSVPLFRNLTARVVVLDLSPSMMSVDAAPNRLTLAKSIVTTVLRDAAGRQLGLVVFAGDAFTVAPLTRDAATLLHLLHSVETTTLPRSGARVDLGLRQAAQVLKAADVARGDVFLVGDSSGDERARNAAHDLHSMGFPVSVVAVGTKQGGPVRLNNGRLAMKNNEVLVTRIDTEAMEQLANSGQGGFRTAHDLEDIKQLAGLGASQRSETASIPQTKQVPVDDGYWFVLALLPLAALLFRRGCGMEKPVGQDWNLNSNRLLRATDVEALMNPF
jgi:Ca-activated chloride channel family protein